MISYGKTAIETASTIILTIIGLIIVVYAIAIYNALVHVKNNVEKAWENIAVVLQQRHDQLPKLVDTCMGYMKHEADLLKDIVKIRVGYNEAFDIDDKIDNENKLNDLMRQLKTVWEQYPDLKASQNFLQIQDAVNELEGIIADRREFFNDSVNIFNIRIETFPDIIVAKLLGYKKHRYLDIPQDKQQDVKLKYS